MKKTISIILISILLFILMFFRYGGEILVAEDEVGHMEDTLLVILMGSVADRSLGAVDLHSQGIAGNIIMVNSHMSGSDILNDKDIFVPGDAERVAHILIESGISKEEIMILPGEAESTKDEALVVKDYLKEYAEIEEIILVTSKFHSYRSKLIFSKALQNMDVNVLSAPTPYDTFEAQGWYKDRENIQRVVSEYTKLLHHVLLEQFMM